jgi:hypothetical protein
MALGLIILMKILVFPDSFWIDFEDIEMKHGMVVYNDVLQIKCEFRYY